MSTKDILNEASDEFGTRGSNSDIFQFKKSGDFLLRVLTKPVPMGTHFFGKGQPSVTCIGMEKGCPFHGLTEDGEKGKIDPKTNELEEYKKATVKFVVYLIDRESNKLQLGEIPWSVVKEIGDLEANPDWKFESYPMPYDIRVKVDKENNDPKQVYKVSPSPKMIPLTESEQEVLLDKVTKMDPAGYVAKRKEGQKEKFQEDGTQAKIDAKRKKFQEDMEKRRAEAGEQAPREDYPEKPAGDIPF